jgi:hypothetical protein
MNFNDAEEGAHQVHLSFVDADGRPVLQGIDLPLNVVMPEDAHFATLNCIVNIQPLKFERPGLYAIDVSVDGRQKASIPLLVKYDPPKE